MKRTYLMLFTLLISGVVIAQEDSSPPPPPPQGAGVPSGRPPMSAPSEDPNANKEIEVFAPASGAPASEAIPSEEANPDTSSNVDHSEAPTAGSAGTIAHPNLPEKYNIQTGDTLWDICQKLLDNPWYWPKLWSLNEYISNPHLIYPGNQIVFFQGSETALPKMDVVGPNAPEEPAPQVASIPKDEIAAPAMKESMAMTEIGSKPMQVTLKAVTLVSEKELNYAGKITHSGDPKQNLSAMDHVYMEFNRGYKVEVGDRFQVIEKIKKVSEPGRLFGNIGVLIRKKGVIRVIQIHKHTVEGIIVDNESDSIVRGDKFIPFQSPIRVVTPHKTDKIFEGKIVEAENQQFLISNNDFVYLNLGRKQGVDDGLQLVVVRRGDGVFQGDDKHLPNVVFGKLLVVETGENSSTAYVTDLKDSLSIGDRVRSQVE